MSGSLEGAGGIGGLLERADGYNPTNGIWANHNYYHADGNGNITYMESNSQTLAASYRYDAFGNTLASSGTLASSNAYRFSSKEFIPTVGLYYYLYRFYDPILQRWLNRDPSMEYGGDNLYCFCFNNSLSFVDGDGLGNPGGDQPIYVNIPGIGPVSYIPPGTGSSGGAGASGNLPPSRFPSVPGFVCSKSSNGIPTITTSPTNKPVVMYPVVLPPKTSPPTNQPPATPPSTPPSTNPPVTMPKPIT